MDSKLVPGDFSHVEVNASFRWFSQGSQKQGLEPSANYSFMKKKKH